MDRECKGYHSVMELYITYTATGSDRNLYCVLAYLTHSLYVQWLMCHSAISLKPQTSDHHSTCVIAPLLIHPDHLCTIDQENYPRYEFTWSCDRADFSQQQERLVSKNSSVKIINPSSGRELCHMLLSLKG